MHRDHGIFPEGQGRIQFRRGTTADPDPVEYLYTVNYFNLLETTNFLVIKRKTLTTEKRNIDIGSENMPLPHGESQGNPENPFFPGGKVYFENIHPIRTD